MKRLLPFLLAFVLPIVLIYAWWGGFNPVELHRGLRGPYTYAYVEHVGDYADMAERLPELRRQLEAAGIAAGPSIAVLYSDPGRVPRDQRRARVGYVVPAGSRPPAPFLLDTLPTRQVLSARVRATWMLAPSRAYQALHEALAAEGGTIRMPTVELYEDSGSPWRPGVMTVEVETP
ncbi:MAG: GyrI-like domain-containing protein [Thiobacillaceae bacterium]|nr:GyrI-like domain-containing protein [Thiobacillaceae bacterium]MCX7672053.1 GyrI-like domain-containing protein [Thiobacillaceae bacterium]MDW8323817.1 hypothetical protein [Burkholderiales bacterium]